MGSPIGNEKVELKKGPWTREEDQKLLAYIEEHGLGSWRALPAKAGIQRCGKSCRLRWTNYLRPDIKRGKFSPQEEKDIIRLHALLGNKWSAIATHLPKRTDNEIKNYWNTRLKKRLTRMGIDPVTHKPKTCSGGSAQSRQAAVVSHMAQWETARLEAEARLARESKLLSRLQPYLHKISVPPPPPPPCLDVLKVWQATSSNNSFFVSPGCLESPTSTLNFSVNSCTAPAVLGGPHDVVSMNDFGLGGSFAEAKGQMENLVQLLHHNQFNVANPVDYDSRLPGLSEHLAIDCDGYRYINDTATANVGPEFEENKNYWNDLLNLVSSPVESPVF